MECLQNLQVLQLSPDLAYTHVKHCLGANTNGGPANAAPVSGFGVHLHETLAVLAQVPLLSLQMLHSSADSVCIIVKHCLGGSANVASANAAPVNGFRVHGIHSRNSASVQVPTECLQMLHVSADLAYTHVTHCVGASTNGVSANTARLSGFGAHLRETLPWHKYQRTVCKCSTCKRIWRTRT